jgi:hypothetical protein
VELPSTVYIGLGAVVAAIITAIISFINLVASKDQKTSEFRQQWINDLRSDISEYLSSVNIVSCEAHLYQQLQGEDGITGELLKEFAEKVSSPMSKAFEVYHSVQLRLNTKDDKTLLEAFENMNELFDNAIEKMNDIKKVEAITESIISQSQLLLKQEWKRVKRGEISYYLTKYFVALVVVGSVAILGAYLGGLVDISINLNNA